MKRKKKHRPAEATTISKRYKVPTGTHEAIVKLAPEHGSQGRALQVATELLVRMKRPVKVQHDDDSQLAGQTYKLIPRTAQLIDNLVPIYGTRGNVLAACAAVLQESQELNV
jgi:hypothetical protein